MQVALVGADYAGPVGQVQRLGLGAGAVRPERVVVQQEQRDDHRGSPGARPHRVGIFWRDHAELAAQRHQVLVARLAAQLDRVAGVRPQVVVARHPDDGAVTGPERSQRPLDVLDLLGQVAGHQQPVPR